MDLKIFIRLALAIGSLLALARCSDNSTAKKGASTNQGITLTAAFMGNCSQAHSLKSCDQPTAETKIAANPIPKINPAAANLLLTAAFMGNCSSAHGLTSCDQPIKETAIAASPIAKTSSLVLTAAFFGGCSQTVSIKSCNSPITVNEIATSSTPKH